MSTFHSTIVITNSSDSILNLDSSASSGISSAFPATLSNVSGQNEYTFKQGFDVQIKFHAVYKAANGAAVTLEYYADAIHTFNQNIVPNPANAFGGSLYSVVSIYDPKFTVNGQAVAPTP